MARNHQWTVPRATLHRGQFQEILTDLIAALKQNVAIDEVKIYDALTAAITLDFFFFDTKELLNASIAKGDVDPDTDAIYYGNMKKTKRVVDFQIDEPSREKKPKPEPPEPPAETPPDESPAEDPRQTQVPGTERPTPGVGDEPTTKPEEPKE